MKKIKTIKKAHWYCDECGKEGNGLSVYPKNYFDREEDDE